jgi:hypothetical protein
MYQVKISKVFLQSVITIIIEYRTFIVPLKNFSKQNREEVNCQLINKYILNKEFKS